jgi:Bax protein
MRYYEITNQNILDEGWKDNLKKSAMAGATALGIATGGADIAHHMIDPAVASIEHDKSSTYQMSQDLLDLMKKDKITSIEPKSDVHKNYPKQLIGKEGEELKKLFVDHVTPMIKANNEQILKERNKILKIIQKKTLTPEDNEILDYLYTKYKVDKNNIKDLLKRVDIIPIPMAVSQAALESGWGTSRFAKQANALFGQKTTSSSSIDSKTDKYAKFEDFSDSIESYMRNLNTNKAYDEFRKERALQRAKDGKFNNKALINTLLKYSTRGKEYVRHVKQILASNELDKLS